MAARIVLLYLLSGVAALGLETVWMRWLGELLGATAPAASATLVAFFAGQTLGAWWGGRRAAGFVRPLAAYGRIELAAAGAALLVPAMLRLGEVAIGGVYDALRATPSLLHALRFAVALLATLPASVCFGAALPAVAEAVVPTTRRVGSGGSALYAANTLGAALGACLAAFVLPGRIGVRGTYTGALLLLLLVGAAALALARGQPARATAGAPAARRPASSAGSGGLLAVAAASGFCAFAFQVLAVHALAQVLNGSVFAFGAVTASVLGCLAAGSALVSLLARRSATNPLSLLGAALVGAAVLAACFPAALSRMTHGMSSVGAGTPGLPYLAAALGTSLAAAGPALLAAALVLPLTFAAAARRASDAGPGAVLGRLLAANTAGSLAGALCAPYLLMPWLGLWGAFLAVAGVHAAAALALPGRGAPTRRVQAAALAAAGVATLAFASPFAVEPARLRADERVLSSEATPHGVVQTIERPDGRLLRIDGHYALGGTAEQVHEERQAHLSLLLAPDARSVAWVGSATGISAGAVLLHPGVDLALVERIPGVVRAAGRFFAAANRDVYASPRVRVVVDDARNFLRHTHATFDLVVADLFVPWRAGTGALYTREHFEAVRRHLAPDGAFVQWLPLYQLSRAEFLVIAATFQDVFSRATVFRGDFYGRFPIVALAGTTGPAARPVRMAEASARLDAGGVRDRWVTHPLGVWALYVGPLDALAPALAAAPRNRDDRPWLELAAAAGHAGGDRGNLAPLIGLDWARLSDPLQAAAGGPADPVWPALGRDERRAVAGGARLQQAGALWVSGRADAAARAFVEAAALLPARLVAAAEPDPTAAELWRDASRDDVSSHSLSIATPGTSGWIRGTPRW